MWNETKNIVNEHCDNHHLILTPIISGAMVFPTCNPLWAPISDKMNNGDLKSLFMICFAKCQLYFYLFFEPLSIVLFLNVPMSVPIKH